MPQWTILQDTPIILSPNQLATDEGWSISGTVAYHDGCFGGIIILKNIAVEAGKTYILDYKVSAYTYGEVWAIVGGVEGVHRDELGNYSEEFVVPDGATDLTINFYSDGTLGVSYMDIYPVLDNPNNSITLGFNSDKNRWTTYYSWEPKFMLKFVDDLFSWSPAATLWKHNVNPLRNNFYGEQFYSEVEIVLNIAPTTLKNLFSLRVNSNLAWGVTNIYIRPVVGKQDGQQSVIKSGNFININGVWAADFLRNMLDPRFNSEIDALFAGAQLQGCIAVLRLRSEETVEVRLVSIDILGSQQDFLFT